MSNYMKCILFVVIFLSDIVYGQSFEFKYFEAAVEYYNDKNYEQAELNLRAQLQITPKHFDSVLLISKCFLITKNYAQSQFYAFEATKLDSTSGEAHTVAGLSGHLMGSFVKQQEWFPCYFLQKGIELDDIQAYKFFYHCRCFEMLKTNDLLNDELPWY